MGQSRACTSEKHGQDEAEAAKGLDLHCVLRCDPFARQEISRCFATTLQMARELVVRIKRIEQSEGYS